MPKPTVTPDRFELTKYLLSHGPTFSNDYQKHLVDKYKITSALARKWIERSKKQEVVFYMRGGLNNNKQLFYLQEQSLKAIQLFNATQIRPAKKPATRKELYTFSLKEEQKQLLMQVPSGLRSLVINTCIAKLLPNVLKSYKESRQKITAANLPDTIREVQ